MGLGRFVHHIGTFLLLVAAVLLIVVSITAPVVNDIAILKVDLGPSIAGSEINLGTFGWCVIDVNGRDECSKAKIGYNPAEVISAVDNTDFSGARESTTKALTRVMILHPIAAGLCFLAFLLCLGAGILGSFLASMVAFLAFIVTLVALICDFVGFALIRSKVNDDRNGSHARFSVGIWLVLAAGICSLIATVVVFITCCAGRRRDSRNARKMEHYDASPAAPRRRRFWQRGTY